VKEIQRLLLRIGYRPGPVDGMYGPLTRSSVQWFQIKHSLRPSGVVDAATLALLRLRSHGATPPAMPTTAPPQTAAPPAAAPAPAPASPANPASPAAAHKSSHSSAAPAVVAGSIAALALLLLTFLLLRRRRGRREAPPSASEQPSAPEPPRPLPAPRRPERVVAYTRGRHPRDLRHQAETIERACSERGWALAQVVRERRNGNGHRPGLRFALEQLADGAGTRLVACRVEDVGHTRDDLAALLRWCARHGVELVALDVGLDTSTSSGRVVARTLMTSGKRGRFGRSLRRRRGDAPGVDGELAPSSSP
jgi:Putative peptidoglycan binding domain/Resolvase, N terminal domain